MTSVVCGQRLFGRVMVEPGPAPNHTSLQPRSDSDRVGEGRGQRFLSLGGDQTRAPGLPVDVTRPTSTFPSPHLPILPPPHCQSCVKRFTLWSDARTRCLCLAGASLTRCTEARVEETKRHTRVLQEVLSQKQQMYTLNVAGSEASHNELQ